MNNNVITRWKNSRMKFILLYKRTRRSFLRSWRPVIRYDSDKYVLMSNVLSIDYYKLSSGRLGRSMSVVLLTRLICLYLYGLSSLLFQFIKDTVRIVKPVVTHFSLPCKIFVVLNQKLKVSLRLALWCMKTTLLTGLK